MGEIAYGRYEDGFRAIHSALSDLTAPPPGKKITKMAFSWNPDGTVSAIRAYDGAELLFALSLTWDVSGQLQDITRT
jgi:hypothetical protein